jgi:DNA replication protein DnaC
MSIAELESRIVAIGRPAIIRPLPEGMRPIPFMQRNLAEAKAWDAQNPERAAEYQRLCEELDAEFRRVDAEARERANIDRALRRLDVRLERSGAGERSLQAAAKPDTTEALEVVKRWLGENGKHWLALCGSPGTGKSVAATWAVREALRAGSTAAFRRTAEVAKLSGFEAGAAELKYLKGVDLLALDDFGAELLTDYARAQLFELLDARHEAYGRTILTSNLQWQGVGGMAERLGERLVDRIAEAGTRQQLAATKSMRRKPKETS